ncbi:MAG: hypothetical protein H6587_10995 [Flavobacteriales bacterium]|nr:hypothetical protein [Flavobacteriales bacterium]MCB9365085.1 hypothetical protein [Flavobacteriales bacterium]
MDKINKYAELFVKLEFIKTDIAIFQNEIKSCQIQESSGRVEIDFMLKTNTGNCHELVLQTLNLEKGSILKIPKELIKTPKENLWIALVLVMKNMNCSLYLIPTTVFLHPKKYAFLAKTSSQQTYWEINVFLETIPELSQFSLANVIEEL